MQVSPHIPSTKVTFEDLAVGDCYRTENGEAIYMKVKAKNINTVALESGVAFKHNNHYRVWRVNGTFIERPLGVTR